MSGKVTHLIILRHSDGMRIEKWTDAPEVSERFWREQGAYVFEGGEPQPIRTDLYAPDRYGMLA